MSPQQRGDPPGPDADGGVDSWDIYLLMGYRNFRPNPGPEVQIQWTEDQGRIYDLQWVSIVNLVETDVEWQARITMLMAMKQGKEFEK